MGTPSVSRSAVLSHSVSRSLLGLSRLIMRTCDWVEATRTTSTTTRCHPARHGSRVVKKKHTCFVREAHRRFSLPTHNLLLSGLHFLVAAVSSCYEELVHLQRGVVLKDCQRRALLYLLNEEVVLSCKGEAGGWGFFCPSLWVVVLLSQH